MMCEKNRNSRMGIVVLLLVVACLFSPIPSLAGSSPNSAPKDEQRLAGKWLRPDGGYMLELSNVKKDGALKAAYFNPRPINVAKASWRREQGRIIVFVKLQDVNYPGSTYTLIYVPEQDMLAGYYFQAALGQTFEVLFERKH